MTIITNIHITSVKVETFRYINTMSRPIKVDNKTIELTVHTSCYCVLDLLCVIITRHLSYLTVASLNTLKQLWFADNP